MLLIASAGSLGAAAEGYGIWQADARFKNGGFGLQYGTSLALLILTAWGAHRAEATGGAMLAVAGAVGFIAYPIARRGDYIGPGMDKLAHFAPRLGALFFSVVAAQASGQAAATLLPIASIPALAFNLF